VDCLVHDAKVDRVQIYARFQFSDEPEAAATTGVAGQVSDFILPCVGDFVSHQDIKGEKFLGKVLERHYRYTMSDGSDVDGSVAVTLILERIRKN
jgi:hypothetical protein